MIGEVARANSQDSVKDMVGLRDTISGLFDDFFSGKPLIAARHLQSDSGIGWGPAVDVRETEEEVVVYADLPGVDKEDIQLEVKDHVLVLTGKRKQLCNAEDGWLRRETPYGQFFRAFSLSADVKANQVTANFKSGVLEIHLPKAEEAKPHRVKIG
jgi:HSP20 family protein